MIICFRYRQLEHIRRLNIRRLLKHRHQLRQVIKPGKACFRSIPSPLRCQFNGSNSFAKGACPGIKVQQVFLFERSILKIFLHRVHLHHAVADWGARRKYCASATSNLVQITAFHIQITGFHRLRLTDTAHIPHLRKCGKVFIVMCLVHKQSINT